MCFLSLCFETCLPGLPSQVDLIVNWISCHDIVSPDMSVYFLRLVYLLFIPLLSSPVFFDVVRCGPPLLSSISRISGPYLGFMFPSPFCRVGHVYPVGPNLEQHTQLSSWRTCIFCRTTVAEVLCIPYKLHLHAQLCSRLLLIMF